MNHDPYNNRQGRIGMESTNASRAIFGLPPLTELDEDDDEPPWSLSDVEPGFWVVIGVSLLGIAYGLYGLAQLLVAGWKP